MVVWAHAYGSSVDDGNDHEFENDCPCDYNYAADIILMTTMGIVMIIVMRVAMPTTTVGNIGVTMT